MRIYVQNRKTKAFLNTEGRWVNQMERARQFANSLEALRTCADRNLFQTDMLVCFSDHRPNLRTQLL